MTEPRPYRIILNPDPEYESGYSAGYHSASENKWESREKEIREAIKKYSKHSINLKKVNKVILARIKQAVAGTNLEEKVDEVLEKKK